MKIESRPNSTGTPGRLSSQIDPALIALVFDPKNPIETDVSLGKNLVTSKQPVSKIPKFQGLSRYNEPQRDLIIEANLRFLDLMNGVVDIQAGDGPVLEPLPFVEKVKSGLEFVKGQNPLVQAMVEASKWTIDEFNWHYKILAPVLEAEMRTAGASGMALSILESVRRAHTGNKQIQPGRFKNTYPSPYGPHSVPGVSKCLGPYIGSLMVRSALAAAAEMSETGDPSLFCDQAILTIPGAQEGIAAQILTAYPKTKYDYSVSGSHHESVFPDGETKYF